MTYDIKLTTHHYEVAVNTQAQYGYFEHLRYGDERGGKLWFSADLAGDLYLVDYDGVFSLPAEVVNALRGEGIRVNDNLF